MFSMKRSDFECGAFSFDPEVMQVSACTNLGVNMRSYGVELVLPCKEHYDEREDGWLRDLVTKAFDHGVESGISLERYHQLEDKRKKEEEK